VNDSIPAVAPDVDEGLVRGIGVRSLAANIVNQIVGSGIFVLPAAVAAILGPAAVIAYLVCAVGIGLLALCFAELGSRVTRSGGTYAYIEAALGPFPGFLAGILLWFGGEVISSAALSVVVVDSVTTALGLEATGVVRTALLIVLLGGLAAANIRGVRTGAGLVEVITAAKLAPLILLIALGLYASSSQNLVWAGFPSLHDIGRASLILVFAFTGTEAALSPSGEVKAPARTIPRAILFGLLIVTSLYIGVHLAAQGILGPALASEQRTPLAAAAGVVMGATGRRLILAGMLISAFGYLTGNILAAPRMLFAFARDGSVPAFFGAVHPRYRTPYIAIATHAALACAFALTGTFRALAVLSVMPTLLVFLGCCAATIILRRRDVRSDGPPFRIPGGWVVPAATAVFVLWLLSSAGRNEVLVVAAILAVASALYVVGRRARYHATADRTDRSRAR
jgi:APA family basic amino acid/polyamine antiporter